MTRPRATLELAPAYKTEILRRIKAPSTPQKAVLRARIVLKATEDKANAKIAQELKTSRVTVDLWCQRFIDLGHPGWLAAEKIRQVLTQVVQPPKGKARRSYRGMLAFPKPPPSASGQPMI